MRLVFCGCRRGSLFPVRALLALFLVLSLFSAAQAAPRKAYLDDLTVVYDDLGQPEGEAILFVHGWACDASVWRFQLPAFSEAFRVLAVDLPGFGRSDRPKDREYTVDLFAAGLEAVLEASGVGKAVIVGHSMGYAVGLELLARRPQAVAAFVNVDGAYFRPPRDEDPQAWWASLAQFAEGFGGPGRDDLLQWFIGETFYGKTDPAVQQEVRALMGSVDRHVAYSSMAHFVRPETWRLRGPFGVPALAVYSYHDSYEEDHADYLRRTFPDLVYEEWDDTGHFLMMERPGRFNALLRRFVDSALSR
jgi:pimeloyl-ACP methyl ester carboxylesterase